MSIDRAFDLTNISVALSRDELLRALAEAWDRGFEDSRNYYAGGALWENPWGVS